MSCDFIDLLPHNFCFITVNPNAVILDFTAKYMEIVDTKFVVRRGKSSMWFLNNFNKSWVQKRRNILLQVGAVDVLELCDNDLISANSSEEVVEGYAVDIFDRIVNLVSVIRTYNPHAVVIVSGILPLVRKCDKDLLFTAHLIGRVNTLLESDFKTLKRTIYLDTPKSFIGKQHIEYNQLFPDGIHVARMHRNILINKYTQAFTGSFKQEKLAKQRKARSRRIAHFLKTGRFL